jgi:hypothetical protein
VQSSRKAKRNREAAAGVPVEDLALSPKDFDQNLTD